MTQKELAVLVIALDIEAKTLRRRVKATRALTIGMALDELDALATRMEQCARVAREYHTAMTPKDNAA